MMNKQRANLTPVLTGTVVVLAFVLWYVMFALKPWNFWFSMTISVLLLAGISLLTGLPDLSPSRWNRRDILAGIVSAILLYIIFFIGNSISQIIIPGQQEQVAGIYGNKGALNPYAISALLLFIIGPGEEIIWRGTVQKYFADRYSQSLGFVVTTSLYTLVHLSSGNFMLIGAALVCGIFWGLLYWWRKSLLTVIISHGIWDVLIFIIAPIQ